MKQSTAMKGRRVSRGILILIVALALINAVGDAIGLWINRASTSFPWWSAFAFAGMLYAVPIILALSAYIFFRFKGRAG